MKQKILDEIDKRITDYGDFRHEMTAKVCILELIELHKWIESIADDADSGLPKATVATEIA